MAFSLLIRLKLLFEKAARALLDFLIILLRYD